MHDIRYAFRSLLRSPGFAAATILTLAIAIGANTAMFSILYGVVLQPLAIREPSRVMRVFATDQHNASFREGASMPDFADWKAQQSVFSAMAGMASRTVNLTGSGADAEQINALGVSHTYFPLLGIRPIAGRDFIESDDTPGAAPVAILNEAFWRRRFGGAVGSQPTGQPITLDGQQYQVIGVMPALSLSRSTMPDLWVPLITVNPQFHNERGVHNVYVIGRLKDGLSVAGAQGAMNVIAARLRAQYPEDNVGRGVFVEPALDFIVRDARPRLYILAASVFAVLLIACINVAGLMLARADARSRELAIRASIGASRGRLVRQLLTESAAIGLTGAVLGVALAWWLTRTMVALAPELPRAHNVALNVPALLFALVASLLSAMLFGVIPAIRSSAVRPAGAITSSRGVIRATGTAGRGVLVIAEVALAVVLVIGAGLLLKSFSRLMDVDLGMNSEKIVTFSMQLPDAKYPSPPRDKYPEWPQAFRFYDTLVERVSALPGASSVAIAANHPLDDGFTSRMTVVGKPEGEGPPDEVRVRPVAPRYIETLGIAVLRGRTISRDDRVARPLVVVVNEALAQRYFPNEDPIGKQVEFWGQPRTIAGLIRGERFGGPQNALEPALYLPLAQVPMPTLTLVVRTGGDPSRMIGAVRAAIRAIDSDIALFDVDTLDATVARSVATPRFQAVLITSFGAIALLLAAIGLYALIAYQVQQRTNEIGIRMALGATTSEVARMILRRAAVLALTGVAIGLAGALATRRFLSALLFQISATDPAIYVSVPILLCAIALAASYIPARRAMRVDPAVALRTD